jgi:hypothetical protein
MTSGAVSASANTLTSMLGSLKPGAGGADHDAERANDATGLSKPESGRLRLPQVL